MSNIYDFIIIGGGACGLMAAATAARLGDRTLVIEKEDRVGKKLLATGNGRCNLLNRGEPKFFGSPEFAQSVLSLCPEKRLEELFSFMGLTLREEEGRVYPSSMQAAGVLDTLRRQLRLYGAEISTGEKAARIAVERDEVRVATDKAEYLSKRVLISGGGMASPKLGSDGSCYNLLKALGIPIEKPLPALTPILSDKKLTLPLSGIRIKTRASVISAGKTLCENEGEALFTDYGVSGVVIMQLSRAANKALMRGEKPVLRLNLLPAMGLPAMSENELADFLRTRAERFAGEACEELLIGALPRLLSLSAAKRAGIAGRRAGEMSASDTKKLAEALMHFDLPITGTRGFEGAQVTAGGADTGCFDPRTLRLKKLPQIQAGGEVLNVDGDCGGFNLEFAFACGYLAGLDGRRDDI